MSRDGSTGDVVRYTIHYKRDPDYSQKYMSNAHPITDTAATIAAQLGETESTPRATIWRIVRTLGPERTQAFVAQEVD